MPRRADWNTRNGPKPWSNVQQEQTQQQTSRRFSSSRSDPGFVSGISADERPRRSRMEDDYELYEEQGRRTKPSDSRSSSRGYDSGYRFRSLSEASVLETEPTPSRRGREMQETTRQYLTILTNRARGVADLQGDDPLRNHRSRSSIDD
jgi:hypothetical protein